MSEIQHHVEPSAIRVSDIDIEWHPEKGVCAFEGMPVTMMWVDTTLAGLMAGVQDMVGAERFALALQSEGRKSVEADWQVITQCPDFAEGFRAIANIAAVAGWGRWELKSLDREAKECRFCVTDSWEGRYQKALGVCWGSPMLAGKLAGYASKLFGTNCWADQETFIARGDSCDGFVVRPSSRSIEVEVDRLLATDEATRADMAVALRKLEQEIAERKRAEAQRIEMERRLLHGQKLESLGVLAGGIAHDFNNLLMGVLGNLDVALLNIPASSPAVGGIRQAIRAARRATDLTRQMLAYSGKGRFLVRPTDLNELVRENTYLFRTVIPRTVTMTMRLSEEPPVIEADPGQVQQVVMNRITNAAEAVREPTGVITVTTGLVDCDDACLARSRVDGKPPAGRFAFVEVSDNGCGMDAETLEKLFEPFFTTKFTGRGLGMAAVLGIMRGHKGAILVDSEPGNGATVRVLFPAASKPAPAVGSPAGAAQSANAGRTGTILVVDDEDMVREVYAAFVRAMGYGVLTAADGVEACRLLREHGGDILCVILDLTMPRMDGVSAFREMKSSKPDLIAILSSGYNEQDAIRRFTGEGLAGFIQKPYLLEELQATVERALGRAGTSVK